MSLSQLTAAPVESEALPGKTFAPWSLRDYGEAEREFARRYIADVTAGTDASGTDQASRDHVVECALHRVELGALSYGTTEFNMQLFKPTWLPLMLYLFLRQSDPAMTREKAATFIPADESERNKLQLEMINALGFGKKASKGEAQAGGSSGNQSSESSAGAETLVMTTSPA